MTEHRNIGRIYETLKTRRCFLIPDTAGSSSYPVGIRRPRVGEICAGLPEHYKTLKLIGFAPDLYYFAFMLSADFGPGNWKPLSQPELWLSYREQCMRQDLFTP